ncbi:GNAT family N-acetyltransferase [Actinoallomurus sp. WRP6H-15]|nr:GNAT family N-acetyltransferase [Actinoallomurus soli]
MTEGLNLVVRPAFEGLRLHRLEAQIQPDNHASIGLVRRLGSVRCRVARCRWAGCGRARSASRRPWSRRVRRRPRPPARGSS